MVLIQCNEEEINWLLVFVICRALYHEDKLPKTIISNPVDETASGGEIESFFEALGRGSADDIAADDQVDDTAHERSQEVRGSLGLEITKLGSLNFSHKLKHYKRTLQCISVKPRRFQNLTYDMSWFDRYAL